MTLTYLEMEAAVQLLEEKERDLELAAQIGQTLVDKNKEVTQQNDVLEEKLSCALEEVSQLRHEMHSKEDLLCFYTDAEINSANDLSLTKCSSNNELTCEDFLHGKVQQLESENSDLLKEKSLMIAHTEEVKNKEQALKLQVQTRLSVLRDDLQSANCQIQAITSELSKCKYETCNQSHEISTLLQEVAELQEKHGQLLTEHDHMQHQLITAKKSQDKLSQELENLKCKYHEALNTLDETHDEIYMLHDPNLKSDSGVYDYDISLGWNASPVGCFSSQVRVNDISCVNQSVSCTFPSMHVSIPRPLLKPLNKVNLEGACEILSADTTQKINDKSSPFSTHKFSMPVQLCSTPLSSSVKLKKQQSWFHRSRTENTFTSPLFFHGEISFELGQPGVPGTNDLEQAIENLTYLENEKARRVEQAKKILVAKQNVEKTDDLKHCVPTAKLRFVKSMEGSVMLQKWRDLAECSSASPNLTKSPNKLGLLLRNSLALSQNIEKCLPNKSVCTLSKNRPRNHCVSEILSPTVKGLRVVNPAILPPEKRSLLKVTQKNPLCPSLATIPAVISQSDNLPLLSTTKSSESSQPQGGSAFVFTELHGSNERQNS